MTDADIHLPGRPLRHLECDRLPLRVAGRFDRGRPDKEGVVLLASDILADHRFARGGVRRLAGGAGGRGSPDRLPIAVGTARMEEKREEKSGQDKPFEVSGIHIKGNLPPIHLRWKSPAGWNSPGWQ